MSSNYNARGRASEVLGWTVDAIDHFVVHQVSKVHTEQFAGILGIDLAKVFRIYPEFGNIGPAGVPVALHITASGYERDAATGLAVSLELRAALFEHGENVDDPAVLARIAAAHDLAPPSTEPSAAVTADYDDGKRRGVKGSPHFFVASDDFFCPALDLGHDDEGHLTARFDAGMLAEFFARIDA